MNIKTLSFISLTSLAFSLTLGMNVHAKIYKWTDENGQTHYTATPPTIKKVKVQEIEDKILMSTGKYDPSRLTSKQNNSEDKELESEDDNEDDSGQRNIKDKPTKQLIEYCKNQRNSLKILKNNQNISWEKFGKKINLSAAQRKTKIKKAKENITEECKGV